MLKLNNKILEQSRFGDGTLKMSQVFSEKKLISDNKIYTITWLYDNDSELFSLQCLVDHIREYRPKVCLVLEMPYIPNARQDRKVSERLFTLKTFCRIINDMKFDCVKVLDPHSDVSTALLKNIAVDMPIAYYWFSKYDVDLDFTHMFPDAGAAKKYVEQLSYPINDIIIGNKHRNAEGRIESYELINFKPGTKKVVIVDDICSFGGTFVAAAKALKDQGVEQIDLVVSHCEENIFKGQVFDYIDHVYTTDSILDINQLSLVVDKKTLDKIVFLKEYRKK